MDDPEGYKIETNGTKTPPAWLLNHVDKKLDVDGNSTLQQDTNGTMFQTTKVETINGIKQAVEGIYYGSKAGDSIGVYKYGGPWSETMADNASANISFEGLAQSNSATELYDNLIGLLGCAVGIPCGTCDDEYMSIGFAGSYDGTIAFPKYFSSNTAGIYTTVDLSEWKAFKNKTGEEVNCFDKVVELMAKHAEDDTLSDQDKINATKALGDEIAKALCDKVYNAMVTTTEYQNHFDKALKNGDYSIVVYDYRDNDKLMSLFNPEEVITTNAPVNVTANSYLKIPNKYLPPDTYVLKEHPVWIQCSSQEDDGIPIDLPDLSLERLGIKDYNVARYDVEETIIYSEEYTKKLDEWNADVRKQTITIPAYTEERVVLTPSTIYENGELKTLYNSKIVQVEVPEHTMTKLVHNKPKPDPQPGDVKVTRKETYIPDDVSKIKYAMSELMLDRARLGAQQNRLEHAYNNNQNKYENTTAAESRIRDTDMAKEMVDYSKHNILTQVGQSMMAQANQSKQGVLSLLQ